MANSLTEPATVRILSYNVHGQHDDRRALAAVVRGVAPDIVVIQEAPRRFRWRTKTAELAHQWGMLYAAGGLPSLGNVILTSHRIRVRATWCLRYPLTPGRHLRGAVFARCSLSSPAADRTDDPNPRDEVTFVVAGTHLATDDAERPQQARAFLAAITAIDDPVIAALDANETADGPSWTLIADSLVDAAVASGDDRPTFPSVRPRRRLDAIFVDRRCTVVSYDVLGSPDTAAASDHRPVLAEIRLPF